MFYIIHQCCFDDFSINASASGHLPEARPYEQFERYKHGGWIPRQAEEQRCSYGPEGYRLAGLHGDAPEIEAAEPVKSRLYEVLFANRYAAGTDDYIYARIRNLRERKTC